MGGHPLASLLRDVATGRPAPRDGQVRVLPVLPGPVHVVVGFGAHHVVAAPVSVAEVDQALVPGDPGGPLKTPFVAWLGDRLGVTPGGVELVLAAPERPATPPLALTRRDDLGSHPGVRGARRFRSEVEVFTDTDARGVLVLGRGLCGRLEVAFEVDEAHRGRGVARGLAAAAAAHVSGEPLFAQARPANAAAVRVLLAAGFRPLGAEVLLPKGQD